MRVAYVSHYGSLLGANRSLLGLCRAGRAEGIFEPTVMGPGGSPLMQACKGYGIPFHAIPGGSAWHGHGGAFEFGKRPIAALKHAIGRQRRTRAIRRRLAVMQPDLVHANSIVETPAAVAALREGYPLVWHAREYGGDDYDLAPDDGWNAFHDSFGKAHARVFVSSDLRDHFGFALDSASHVVYNGVDDVSEGRELARNPPGDAIGFMGALYDGKGCTDLLDAFAMLRDIGGRRLLIAGEGPARVQLSRRVSSLGIQDKVTFLGHVSDPGAFLAGLELLVVPSKREAMGRVVGEAMWMGVPLLVRNAGGAAELAGEGERAAVFEGPPEALAEAMSRVMADPETDRRTRRAKAWARKNLTHAAAARRLAAIYGQVLHV